MEKKKLDSALLALGIAIQTEKDGREFYLGAARKTSDSHAKALFNSLADDELDHLHLLEEQQQALQEEQRWLPHSGRDEGREATKVAGAPIFSPAAVGGDINAHTSELSALRMAFLMEKDAVAFYSRAASETHDPDGKAMYQYLVGMEKEHQRILKEEYDALSRQFWTTMGFEPF